MEVDVSFRSIAEAILEDDKPCGCPSGGNWPDNGIMWYSMAPFWERHPEDLEECRLCGAVWRVNDRLPWGT
jgi:hypothetical protein